MKQLFLQHPWYICDTFSHKSGNLFKKRKRKREKTADMLGFEMTAVYNGTMHLW